MTLKTMNAVSLNHLWSYLQGLSLTSSNQRWLGERLIEASAAGDDESVCATTVGYGRRLRKRRVALSDEELAECLAQYAPFTDADFPDVKAEEYADFAKSRSGRMVVNTVA